MDEAKVDCETRTAKIKKKMDFINNPLGSLNQDMNPGSYQDQMMMSDMLFCSQILAHQVMVLETK